MRPCSRALTIPNFYRLAGVQFFNYAPRDHRIGRWFFEVQIIAILGAAVIGTMTLAGCHTGPGPQHTEVNGGGKTPYERALAITQCMRHHGDPSFPSPRHNGAFPASAQENKFSPSYRAAVRARQGLPRADVGNTPS
jgi:hypothetical protein